MVFFMAFFSNRDEQNWMFLVAYWVLGLPSADPKPAPGLVAQEVFHLGVGSALVEDQIAAS
jgi:hypothetical protein